MSIYLAEFIGTFLVILFGGGVVAGAVLKHSKSENAGWLTICAAWGFGVAFAIYAVGSISGAHLNPAVTLSLAFVGEFPWTKVPGYLLSQIFGAFTGGVIVWIFYMPLWSKTQDQGAKLAVFCTGPAIRSLLNNFINEMLATAILIFALLFIGTNNFTEGLNPLVIGVLIIAIGLSLGGTTGFAINPARDFGPRLAHFLMPIKGKGTSDWGYALIPITGPILGGLIGASAYQMLYKNEFLTMYWIVLSLGLIILGTAVYKNVKS